MDLLFFEIDEKLHAINREGPGREWNDTPWLEERFVASWIYHDLSIEGAIFRDDELERGLRGREGANWSENRLLEKVRCMARTLKLVQAPETHRSPYDLDFIKSIHRALTSDGDDTAGKYRKDAGPSTAYRHDISPPTGISYRLRRMISWIEDEGRGMHAVATACEIHRQLIETFPFHRDNGCVARMAMNAWLLRLGYPPAVIHIHDRNEYWDSYLTNGRFRRLIAKSILQSANAQLSGSTPAVKPEVTSREYYPG